MTVETAAGKNTILRHLSIISTSGCTIPGIGSGIDLKSGGALHLENVTVHGFADSGLKAEPGPGALVSGLSASCVAGV